MLLFSRGLLAVSVGFLLAGTSCSQIEPAGSLGYMMNGATNLRPTPTNFRHMPPRDQDRAPTPMQWGLDF